MRDVMETTGVIDLGDTSAAQRDQPTPDRSGWGGWSKLPRWTVFLLVPVVLVLLGGAAVPHPRLTPVRGYPGLGAAAFDLSDDHMFVSQYQSNAPAVITAYRIADGRRIWQATLATSADGLAAMPAAGVLLASSYRDDGDSLVALDMATGQVRWRLPQETAMVLSSLDRQLLTITLGTGKPVDLRLRDIASGQVVWSRQLPAGTDITPGMDGSGLGYASWIVAQAPDGLTQIIDYASGRVLRSAQLPAPHRSDPAAWGSVAGVAGLVLTSTTRGPDTTLTAYGADTLTKRWETHILLSTWWAVGCGPMICLSDTAGLLGIDAATGKVSWEVPAWTWQGRVGSALLARDTHDTGQLALIDPITGQVRTVAGSWQPMTASSTLFLGSQNGHLGVWLGVADERTATIQPVGWMADAAKNQCQLSQPTQKYLACGTIRGEIRIWRYRPAER